MDPVGGSWHSLGNDQSLPDDSANLDQARDFFSLVPSVEVLPRRIHVLDSVLDFAWFLRLRMPVWVRSSGTDLLVRT